MQKSAYDRQRSSSKFSVQSKSIVKQSFSFHNIQLIVKTHIANVSRKISKSIGIVYRSSLCLSMSSLIILYYCLVYPYLLYCVSVWGSTYPTNLNRLLLLQKRVVRTITKQAFDAHTEPISKELGIPKLNEIYLLQIGKLMYHNKIGFLLNSDYYMVLMVNQVHNHNTRNK